MRTKKALHEEAGEGGRERDLVTLSALKGLMKEEVETWSDGYNTYYESWYEWDEDAVARMFHSGNCTCNLLNRVLATAEVPTSASFEDLGDGYYYSDDYDGNRNAARQACQNWCDKVNRGVITDLLPLRRPRSPGSPPSMSKSANTTLTGTSSRSL